MGGSTLLFQRSTSNANFLLCSCESQWPTLFTISRHTSDVDVCVIGTSTLTNIAMCNSACRELVLKSGALDVVDLVALNFDGKNDEIMHLVCTLLST